MASESLASLACHCSSHACPAVGISFHLGLQIGIYLYQRHFRLEMPVSNFFTKISNWVSRKTGQPMAFILACIIILVWIITGPLFHFSDTWQLVINTATTIVTFLMVFLIQSTQNRDTTALQLKLDELIYVTKRAHNAMLDIEELSDDELDLIRKNYKTIASHARKKVKIEKLYSQRAKRAIGKNLLGKIK